MRCARSTHARSPFDQVPDAALRQQLDILHVLNPRLRDKFTERIMTDRSRAAPRWVRALREKFLADAMADAEAKGRRDGEREGEARGKREGEAKGKRDALLAVLEERGLSISRAQRAAILACEDLAALDRWIAGSVSVVSVQELLAKVPASKKNGARNGAARHRAARAR